MKLTISNEDSGAIITVDIPGSLTVEDFQAYLQAETDVEPKDQIIFHQSKEVALGASAQKQIEELGFKDDDLLVLKSKRAPPHQQHAQPQTQPGAGGQFNPVNAQVEDLRQRILTDPRLNSQVQLSNPRLHSLLNNPAEFKQEIIASLDQYGPAGQGGYNSQQQAELRRLQENPDDPESQAKILELIQQEQVEENMRLAYEISPESFTSVNMLYINIKVNGHLVKAFVDSGAQTTIISPRLAEKIGIARLIDKRYVGEARGVGSQKIEGKIHSVPITIGDSETPIPCSFVLLETSVDLLFGLDMLRRHKCVIDLERDVLVVGGNIETKFLHEKDIPKSEMFGGNGDPPAGTILGGAPLPAKTSSSNTAGGTPAASAAADAAAKRQRTTTNSSNSTSTQSPTSSYKEEDIQRLINLGFSKQEAIQALDSCNGNVEMAASLLFG
ncbi:DNA damage-inducible protein 1 [[Candida] anglica]|uniref:DNA damage-inducible protein 1 n=1 Tax=[Candida] anglica TaxID=148631 RepID=A0ABP0EHT9_9ASCO